MILSFLASRWRLLLAMLIGLGAMFVAGVLAASIAIVPDLVPRAQARLLGMVQGPPKAPGDQRAVEWSTIETALATIEATETSIGFVSLLSLGGGFDVYGSTILFARTRGELGYIDFEAGTIAYLDAAVPMNQAGLAESGAEASPNLEPHWFRVNDVLIASIDADRPNTLLVNHHVYEDGNVCTVVSRIGLDFVDGAPQLVGDWSRVYTVRPCINLAEVDNKFHGHESGGRLLLDGDDAFLMTVGSYSDGGAEPPPQDSDFGRLLRIDMATGRATTVAEGLRNPQGLTIDHLDRIWTTDHGPQGGDEVNLIEPGANYGWPYVSLGFDYADMSTPRKPIPLNPRQGRHADYAKPAFAFVPSVGVSQVTEIPPESDAFKEWRGDLLVGSLRQGTLYRLRLNGEEVIYAEPIPLDRRIRDIALLEDGRIVLLTDRHTIVVVRDPRVHGDITSDPELLLAGYDPISAREVTPEQQDEDWRRDMFFWKCGACHTFDDTPTIGPSLAGVLGREVGSLDGYAYSPALMNGNGRWSRRRIEAFVRDPAAAGFEGSIMPPVEGMDRWVMEAILDHIAEN